MLPVGGLASLLLVLTMMPALGSAGIRVSVRNYSSLALASQDTDWATQMSTDIIGTCGSTMPCNAFGSNLNKATDMDLTTYSTVTSSEQEHAIMDLQGYFNVQRIVLFLGAVTNPTLLNAPFKLWISNQFHMCGMGENSFVAVPVLANMQFTKSLQAIIIDIDGGLATKYMAIGVVDAFATLAMRKAVPQMAISEIVVFGNLIRTADFTHSSLPVPRETTLPTFSQFSNTVPLLWSTSDVSVPATDGQFSIIAMGPTTQCVMGCGPCNVVVGTYRGTKFGVTTNADLFQNNSNVSNIATRKAIENYLCPGCSISTVQSSYPTSPAKNTLLYVWESNNMLSTQDMINSFLKTLQAGQPMMLVLDWNSSNFQTKQGNTNVESMLLGVGVKRSTVPMMTYKNLCYRVTFVIGSRRIMPVMSMVRFNYGMHSHIPGGMQTVTGTSWMQPPGLSNSEFVNLFGYNVMDYFNMWNRDQAPCLYRPIDLDKATRMEDVYQAYLGDVNVLRKGYFPGVRTYPLMPDPRAPQDAIIVKITDKYGYRNFIPAQIGIRAGDVVSIRVISLNNTSVKRWLLLQQCNYDDLRYGIVRPTTRYPYIYNPGQQLQGNFQDFSFPFGGPVQFGYAPLPQDTVKPYTITLAISGVYRMADFQLKNPDHVSVWESSLKRTWFPMVQVVGDRLFQCGELSYAQRVSTKKLKAMVVLLDKWTKSSNNYKNVSAYSYKGEMITFDWQIAMGFMHSGYPIAAYSPSFETDGEAVQINGAWGFVHELGHNLAPLNATLTDCGEVVNNVMGWMNYFVTDIQADYPMSRPGTAFCSMLDQQDSLVYRWKQANNVWPWNGQLAAYDFFCYFGWKFGFAANGNAYSLVNNVLEFTQAVHPTWSLEELYLYAMSQATGYNMGPYGRLIGFPVSNESYQIMSSKFSTCWMPEGDIFASDPAVQANIQAVSAKLGVHCTGKSYNLTAYVDYRRDFDRLDNFVDTLTFTQFDNTHFNQFQKTGFV